MKPTTELEVRAHAEADYPRESCGLLVSIRGKEFYVPCRNEATTPQEHFILSPEDYADAEDRGDIVAIVHSHPNMPARASEADLAGCESTGLPWYIVRVDQDGSKEMVSLQPTGYEVPLVGRPFVHGVLDCYTLIRDFYKREMLMDLPDFDRRDEWWNQGQNLYMDNFAGAGFQAISDPIKVGDIILMQLRSPVPNHAAVYIGKGLILQHMAGRMSTRDVYGGFWQENTRLIVRHKDSQ